MIRHRQPSRQMRALLAAMMADAATWRHGYDLMKDTGLSSGTLYPLLMRMTEKGLVESEWRDPAQPGRPARHVYRLTAAGIALARSQDDGDAARAAWAPA
ncbi:PadR family transcriptional regulator [Sphingomonas sp. SORGH_AS_0879]|uniref:PadR family transcriptional regulator n=1 Tax=Sphingomonas sp. SORGH_AS_0879 TaxID=3041790 RepID=UPI0027879317|nr:PadR family transcriptional regulator [Sphingomonas sp. SORGH_AS_0879]MDQ1228948.1 PadR family transcriptional regulator PadR [Sphingomonas sp. SORGH_AS_0879]